MSAIGESDCMGALQSVIFIEIKKEILYNERLCKNQRTA